MKVRYSQLTDDEKKIVCNGCGTKLTYKIIPDLFFEADCNQHDFYYKRGGDAFDRMEADVMFYAHMLKSINDKYAHWYQKIFAFSIATVYFIVVRVLGIFAFRWGKYRPLSKIIKKI